MSIIILGDDVNEELAADGPVPWCRKDQLTFIAEQVSHHPPSIIYSYFNINIFANFHIFSSIRILC